MIILAKLFEFYLIRGYGSVGDYKR